MTTLREQLTAFEDEGDHEEDCLVGDYLSEIAHVSKSPASAEPPPDPCAVPAYVDAAMHPNGRCTCGDEGRCDWCVATKAALRDRFIDGANRAGDPPHSVLAVPAVPADSEPGSLTIRAFQQIDVERCNAVFHPLDEWSPTDWACALAGEAGEVCNAVKKLKRGDGTVEAIAKELADVLSYAPLLAARLGIDLEDALVAKFDEVSAKKAYPLRLQPSVAERAKAQEYLRVLHTLGERDAQLATAERERDIALRERDAANSHRDEAVRIADEVRAKCLEVEGSDFGKVVLERDVLRVKLTTAETDVVRFRAGRDIALRERDEARAKLATADKHNAGLTEFEQGWITVGKHLEPDYDADSCGSALLPPWVIACNIIDRIRSKLATAEQAYRIYLDGNRWCAVGPWFRNLQESPAGFGESPREALCNLLPLSEAAIDSDYDSRLQIVTRERDEARAKLAIAMQAWRLLAECVARRVVTLAADHWIGHNPWTHNPPPKEGA